MREICIKSQIFSTFRNNITLIYTPEDMNVDLTSCDVYIRNSHYIGVDININMMWI